jgi:purine-nucleoside phosphorylase
MKQTVERALADLAERGIRDPVGNALVLGTGLSGFADHMEDAIAVPYAVIPGFPESGVSGHRGALVVGRLAGSRVALLQGRSHYYETGDAGAMRVPLLILQALGVRRLLLTNASGAADPALRPGSLVLVTDHINFSGTNPLIGDTGDGRFVSLIDAYSPVLRARLLQAAQTAGVPLAQGVYLWFSGPSFETPAEIRMAQRLGADLVGMSTVPETILARRIGLEVAAVSLVTNLAAGIEVASPSHAETKAVAAAGSGALHALLLAFFAEEPDGR